LATCGDFLMAIYTGDRVLEIGAGTGYNAALLGQLTGPTGSQHGTNRFVQVLGKARREAASVLKTSI
jgi:protein-L-isoaspartate(D-aspartate) O-methyltransferase